jgi:uncharacterized membrane protein YcaP (DUF421 family)
MLLIAWLGIRIIGKKTIAQMTGYELAGVLLLSIVAAEPIAYKVASKALTGVLTLSLTTLFLGYLSLKTKIFNFDSKPGIVISNGIVLKDELKKNKMNVSYLISMLRQKGYFKISEIEYAIIEPNGNISVVPKSQERPIKPKDMKIPTPYEGLSLPLILDGNIVKQNLNYSMLDEGWLVSQLNSSGITEVSDVLIAQLDTEGILHISTKYEKYNIPKEI